jgi:hypothetical protein
MVTHDLALARRARRMVRMEDGQVVEDRPLVEGRAVPAMPASLPGGAVAVTPTSP